MQRREFVTGLATVSMFGCRQRAPNTARMDAPGPVPVHDSYEALRGLCDDVVPPDAAVFATRQARVQAAMIEAGVHAIVLEPGANMEYLAGVRWGRSERPFLLVLGPGGPVWVVPAFERRTAGQQLGDEAMVLTWYEHEDPFAKAVQAIGKRPANAKIALDVEMRTWVGAGLEGALDQTVVGAEPVLVPIRIRKSEAELACLRRANEVTKFALAAASRHARVGMTQSDLAEHIRGAQEAAGLSDVWVLCLFGPAAAFPHGTHEDRALARGDLILVDTGGALHGYRSDITRTWAFGEPDPKARRAWDTVVQAQASALQAIAPGALCGAPDAAARAVMLEAGYGGDYERFTHRLGHGIGLQVHEPPYLVRGSEQRLDVGMTMSNEPGIYVPGAFGVRIEDIVVVTETGAEVFGPPVGPWADPFAGHAP